MAAGAGSYVGVPVRYIRVAFVVLSFAWGFGLVLYVLLILATPSVGRESSHPRSTADAFADRLKKAEKVGSPQLALWAVVLLCGAVVLLGWGRAGSIAGPPHFVENPSLVIPLGVMCGGIGLSWWQLSRYAHESESVRAGQARSKPRLWKLVVQAGVGIVIATMGALMLVLQGLTVSEMARAAFAALVVLIGVGFIITPWWVKLWNELIVTREERAREANRAEMAAHIHDSVLQTLALIRQNASDSARVAQLARSQERDLREWLYQGKKNALASLAQELRDLAAYVEDTRRTPSGEPAVIEVVCVGDRAPDSGTATLVEASREALLNAVSHGAPPISIYMESDVDGVDIFVTDRGDGFTISEIPADRFGVRESIIGRMERGGGMASFRSLPAGGTEVHLHMPDRMKS